MRDGDQYILFGYFRGQLWQNLSNIVRNDLKEIQLLFYGSYLKKKQNMAKICPHTKFHKTLPSRRGMYKRQTEIIPKIGFLDSEDLKTDISPET